MGKAGTDRKARGPSREGARPWGVVGGSTLYLGDCKDVLPELPPGSVDLAYIDPPFNTGKQQAYTKVAAVQDREGNVTGFGGRTYSTTRREGHSYPDIHGDYLGFLRSRLEAAYPLLAANASFFLHVDYREAHYCKLLLDGIFGRDNFMNEIIWAYDYGGRPRRRWAPKHDTIFWYAKDCGNYTFNADAIDRIPYMAPKLVGEAKAKKGKLPTDVWWNTIVGTNSRERSSAQGYPSQKPLAILERIVQVHSNEGDTVLDFFAGSGTTGVAALMHGRKAVLVDSSEPAVRVAQARLKGATKAGPRP